jgi:hypothetical protein
MDGDRGAQILEWDVVLVQRHKLRNNKRVSIHKACDGLVWKLKLGRWPDL